MSSTTDSSPWFERIVYALVMRQEDPAEMTAMGADAAVLHVPRTGSRILLLRHLPERDHELAARLREDIKQLAHAPLEVALIGGPSGAEELLAKAKPRFTRKPVALHHLRDDGTLWHGGARIRRSPLAAELMPPQGAWPPPEDERARFAARIEAQLAARSREQQEMASFRASLQGRRPVATWALAATVALVFALQMLWDGAEGGPVLARMGALVPERIRDGEWWRLVSCTFLHGSFTHLALNTLVLLMLGNTLERILGTSRFLVLYGTSALAGSLASFLAGDDRISVGASGALWGMLVGEAVLAFRPRGLLPATVVAQAKRAAISNLALNVIISFIPGVDTVAHFGGGAVGLLLVGTGVLTMGLRPLPRTADISSENAGAEATAAATASPDTATGTGPRRSIGFTAGAVIAVLVLGVGLALGLVRGRAWAIAEAPDLTRRDVPALGVSVLLPSDLAAGETTTSAEADKATFGDTAMDPVLVWLTRVPIAEPLSAAQMEVEIARLVEDWEQEPGARRLLVPPARFQSRGRPAVRAVYLSRTDVIIDSAAVLEPDRLVRVDVAIWPPARATYEGMAARILESLQPLAAP